MKEHSVNELNNFIMGWYIDPDICDELIDIHKNSNKTRPGGSGFINSNPIIDKNIKDSTDLGIGRNSLPQSYYSALFTCLKLYNNKYTFSQRNNIALLENSILQHYRPGGGFKQWHSERNSLMWPIANRHLVFMTYLNDVTDGGGTEFLYQNTKTNAEKGLTLIWPADWPHTHRSEISLTQEKYIITGWLSMVKPSDNNALK
jgi:hypothetical protein